MDKPTLKSAATEGLKMLEETVSHFGSTELGDQVVANLRFALMEESAEIKGQDEAYMSGYMAGQNKKQAEIAALKQKLEMAEKAHEIAIRQRDNLKAENERLRKDAERYQYLRRWVRGETDLYTEQKTIHFFINPVGDVMKGSVAQHLDEAIDAAMSALPDTKRRTK